MSDKQQIFDDARKFSAQFGGFLRAAEELAKLGNIEDEIARAKSRLMELEDAHADHGTKVAMAETEAAAVRAKAEAYVEARKGEAEQIAQDAKAEAARIKREAEGEAEKLKAVVLAKVTEHENKVTEMQASLAAIRSECGKQAEVLAEVEGQITARRAEHDRVVKMHADLLARIGAK